MKELRSGISPRKRTSLDAVSGTLNGPKFATTDCTEGGKLVMGKKIGLRKSIDVVTRGTICCRSRKYAAPAARISAMPVASTIRGGNDDREQERCRRR